MGQSAEHARDDFKDVQEVEVLSYTNFQKKFCGEAFFGMSSLKTQKEDKTQLKNKFTALLKKKLCWN